MTQFEFLLGEWSLTYRIPKSHLAAEGTDSGTGTIRRILDDRYVQFEYATRSGGSAKGIFGWDDKAKLIRYWWFENSGSFAAATCQFLDGNTLAMNWHDTLLVQDFVQQKPGLVVLTMRFPKPDGSYDTVLEVTMVRT